MNIGIDIDEVVASYVDALNKYLKKHHNLDYTKEDYHAFSFNKVWKLPEDKFLEIIASWRKSEEYNYMEPIPGAKEALNKLAKNNKIFFITCREKDYAQRTKDWIEKQFGLNVPVLHSKHPLSKREDDETKIKICKENNIDVMIEDQLNFTEECIGGHIPVILFDKPWNKGFSNEAVTRVKNWEEAINCIDTVDKINRLQSKLHQNKN